MTAAAEQTPAVTLGAVVLDTEGPPLLAAFWAGLTGGSIAGEHEGLVFVQGQPVGARSWSGCSRAPLPSTPTSTST